MIILENSLISFLLIVILNLAQLFYTSSLLKKKITKLQI